MPENDIIYSVRLSDGRTDKLTQQQYDAIKDKLFADDSGAEVVRTSLYNQGTDDGNASDMFHVRLPDGRTDNLTRNQFNQVYGKVQQDYPGVEVYQVSDMSDQYWRPKLEEAQKALSEFDGVHGKSMSQYESMEMIAKNSEMGEIPNFNTPSHKWLAEHDAEYKPLKKQRDALREAVYTNPIIRKARIRDYEEAMAANDNFMQLADKAESGTDRRDYNRAAKYQREAARLFSAPSQYDEAIDGQNEFVKYIKDYEKGAGKVFNDYDFWSRGLTQITRYIDTRGIRKKVLEAEKAKGAPLDERDFDRIITDAEKAQLMSYYNYKRAQADRANDLSSAYTAGTSFAESLGYMAEFMLSQGWANMAGKALSASSNGFARWMGQALMSEKALSRAVAQGVTAIPEMSRAAKIGTEIARPIVQGLWHTGTQVSTLANMASKLNETNDAGELNSWGRAIWLGFADSLVENWSESFGNTIDLGFEAVGKGLGWAGDKVLGKTTFGQMARYALHSPFTMTLKEAGFNGFFGEMMEEWAGNAVRLATGLMDKDEFKQFASIEQQLEMAASFAPMSLFGLAGNVASGRKFKKEYEKLAPQVKDILLKNGISQTEIDSLFEKKWATTEDIAAGLAPYAQKVLNSEEKGAKSDYATILKFAQLAGANSFNDAVTEYKNEQRRGEMQSAIQTQMNGHRFWMEQEEYDKDGNPVRTEDQVRVVTDAEGKRYYVTSSDAEGVMAFSEEDGRTRFLSNDEIASDNTASLKDYLQSRVEATDKDAEAKRMYAETQKNLAAVKQRIAENPQINIGTQEAPRMVTVVPEANGQFVNYTYKNEEGQDVLGILSWKDVASYLGMPLEAKTDEQITEEAAADMEKAEERKNLYNRIAPGTPITVMQEMGGEAAEPVHYNFAKAIYDANDGFVRVYVTDSNGQPLTDADNNEVWFPEDMVPGLAELAENTVTPVVQEEEVTPEPAVETPVPAVTRYTNEQGKVNQSAFMNHEPAEWAKWNDERNQDGGADTVEALGSAISTLDKEIDALIKKRQSTSNPDDREAIKEQIAAASQRRESLASILSKYAAPVQEEAPVQEQQPAVQNNAVPAAQEEKNGYRSMSPREAAMAILTNENFEDNKEALSYIYGFIKRAKKALEKIQKAVKAVKAENFEDPAEFKQAREAVESQLPPYQEEVDFWNEVKNEAEKIIKLEEGEMREPKTLRQLIANVLHGCLHGLDRASFVKELGLSDTEINKLLPFWAKKGTGLSVQALAEEVAAEDQWGLVPMDSNAEQADTSAVRDEILNLFMAVGSVKEIIDYTENENRKWAEQLAEAEEEYAERALYEAANAEGMTVADYVAREEEVYEAAKEFAENYDEINAIFVELQQEEDEYRSLQQASAVRQGVSQGQEYEGGNEQGAQVVQAERQADGNDSARSSASGETGIPEEDAGAGAGSVSVPSAEAGGELDELEDLHPSDAELAQQGTLALQEEEQTPASEAVEEHPEGTQVPGGELTEAQKEALAFVQGKTAKEVEAEYKAEQKAKEKEAKRQEKLRKRADKWKKFLGEAFDLLTSEEDIMAMQESDANKEAALAEVRNGGHGWYSPTSDKAYIYLPNIKDAGQLDRKILHEVLTHKGLLHLMGRDGYNRFLDSIWEKMSKEQRQWALDYYKGNQFASEKERQRAGTDEFLAAVAEQNESITSMIDENFWTKALEKLKQILNDMAGEDFFTTKETWLDEELMLSFVNLASERRKAEAEQAKRQDIIEFVSEGTPTKEQATGAVEKNPQMPIASSQEKYEDFGEKIGMARKDTAKKGIKKGDGDGRPAWAKKYHTSNIMELSEHEQEKLVNLGGGRRNFQEVINDISKGTDFSKPFVGFYDQEIKTSFGKRTRRHYITDAAGRPLIFTSLEQFEATMPVFEAKDQHFRIRENKGKFQIVRPASNGKLVEYAEFDTKEDAVAYLSSPEGATELLNRKRENYELPALERITRIGMPDYRDGKNITPDDILNTFGFRGGEFGNWLNAEERQQFLNYAYDALMDLADLLGISPRALSLGGELSISFGARGTGRSKAAAHYESGRAVINLTKMYGAGSLAHEWAHAMDNYFGMQDAKRVRDREDKKGESHVFLSEGTSYMAGTRKEVRDAVREVMNVLHKKTVTRAIELEDAEAKLARDRSWYEKEKKANRERLERGRTTYKYNRKTKQYDTVTYKLTDEQLAEFDRLIGQLETDPTFKWEYDFAKGGFRASGEVADKLYELIKDVMPNKKETYGPLNDLFYNLYRRVLPSSQRVKEAKEGKTETVVAETDFYKDSKWFDRDRAGSYWTKDLEMFARAFETYLAAKMKEQGKSSDYLTYMKAPLYMASWDHAPYPQGEELAAATEAFDKLFQTIQEKTDESGKTLLFSKTFSHNEEEFDHTMREAIAKRGIVRSNLAETDFNIEPVSRHNFTGTGKTAIQKARDWAEENLVGEYTYHDGQEDSFNYEITGGKDGSVGKMLSGSSTQRSENLGVHLAVLKNLPQVIESSIDVEIHPDYEKGDEGRSGESATGKQILVHRFYGAVNIDGTVYRVKTTIKEYRDAISKAYTYRVTEVELPISGSKASNALGNSTTISGANLLENVDKSYDSGKKLLDDSGNSLLFSKAYHGTDAEFDRFDLSYAGSGEGVWAHGYGQYFSLDESVGRKYAYKLGGTDEEIERAIGAVSGEIARNEIRLRNARTDMERRYYEDAIAVSKKRKEQLLRGERHLYTVELPDDNGENYIDEKKTLPKSLRKRIANVVSQIPEEKLARETHGPNWLPQGFSTLANIIEREQFAGLEIRQRIEDALGNTIQAKKETSKILHDAGFVGMKYEGGIDGPCVVIFDDKDIEIVDHLRFSKSNQTQNGFVSNAEMAAAAIPMQKATPEQWAMMLEKAGGLKAGEDKWLGLSDWLNEQKGTITKQQVLDYINEHRIQLEEVHYSNVEESNEFQHLQNEFYEMIEGDPEYMWEQADQQVQEFYAEMEEKYGDDYLYQMTGEERNVEDRLLTERERWDGKEDPSDMAFEQMVEKFGDDFELAFTHTGNRLEVSNPEAAASLLGTSAPINDMRENYQTKGLTNNHEIALTVPSVESYYGALPEVHFADEYTEGKTVARIRFGDAEIRLPEEEVKKRKDAQHAFISEMKEKYGEDALKKLSTEGRDKLVELIRSSNHTAKKVLFIDEIQSKRHQDAREMGYRNEKEIAEATERIKQMMRFYGVHNIMQLEQAIEENQHIEDLKEFKRLKKAVPPAPFEKNWHELAMKRMLRLAAEEGYDYVAWTTGEQQAERYSLTQYVNGIQREDNSEVYDGKRFILYSGRKISLGVNEDGKIETSSEDSFVGNSLSDVVGKEVAVKMMSMEDGEELDTDDLKVGGSGMKGFYDDILPRFMNKYGKKWGISVKPGQVDLADGKQITAHTIPVTEEMKESVMEGQLMFSKEAEAVEKAHAGGIGSVIGEDNVGEFYMDIYKAVPKELRGVIVDKAMGNGMNFRKAISERLSEIARKGFENDETGLLLMAEPILSYYAGEPLGQDAIRYILWRGERKASDTDMLDVAEDIAMRRSLKIGTYAEPMRFSKEVNIPDADSKREKLLNTQPVDVTVGVLTGKNASEARDNAINWWNEHVKDGIHSYDTEVGTIDIDAKSIKESLSKGFSQPKLDAVTSLEEGFGRATYITSMRDLDGKDLDYHYFVYPISYDGGTSFVLCRAKKDMNTRRLYVHEVFPIDVIKGELHQTRAGQNQPPRGIALYLKMLRELLNTESNERQVWNRFENDSTLLAQGGSIGQTDARSDGKDSNNSGSSQMLYSKGELKDELDAADTAAEKAVDQAKETLDTKKDELRNHLLTAMRAMSAQKEYDKATVEAVASLAKALMRDQYIDTLNRREVSRLLGIVRSSVGKSPKMVKRNSDALVEMVIDHLLKREKAGLEKLTKGTGTKVNATGVEVQGELDVQGQKILKAYKEGIKHDVGRIDDDEDANTLYGMRAENQEHLESTDDAVRKEAEAIDVGLALAIEYKEGIKELADDETKLLGKIEDLDAKLKNGDISKRDHEQQVRATKEAIRENQIEQVEEYRAFRKKMQAMISGSIEAKKSFVEREKERVETIRHYANSDMQGLSADIDSSESRKDALANNPLVRFFAAPLATFDQMLRMFGRKSTSGMGYLWSKFMDSWNEATAAEFAGKNEAMAKLDKKVSEVFGRDGMTWSDLFKEEGDMDRVKVPWRSADGGKVEHELNQGQLLYILMVDKMADGRMKLRKMGIMEEDVAAIRKKVDERFIRLADWLQEEYLVELRNKYNAVHERLFGASMASIENYFPLVINQRGLNKGVDIAKEEHDTLSSTTTGAIIKRRRNDKPLDLLNADAFSVVLKHIDEMETWAAFAEFNKDINALLSYKRFRNQVQNMATVYGARGELWRNFTDVCKIAGGKYKPSRKVSDSYAVNVAKGVSSAKISFRVYTAIKQLLSFPAYLPNARVDDLAKSMATPGASWKWCMENLPLFEKRWKSRIAGDTRLMTTEMDWNVFRGRAYELMSKYGMMPNAFVDAVTVAIGTKAMYDTKYRQYINDGYTEEQADKRAKLEATVLYNETQQSNESAFVSPVQLDRSWLSTGITLFRNSSMGYQRQVHDAIRNLGRILRNRKEYKEESIAFMTKQMMRDGLTEEQAKAAAERKYKRAIGRDFARVGTFAFLVQFAWNLGGSLAYLLFGDDDDEKNKMLEDAFWRALATGTVEGLAGGNVISEVVGKLINGESLRDYDPTLLPIVSDMKRLGQLMSYDKVAGFNELANLAVQAGIGVNPQTLTDAIVAVYDACNGDLDTSKEAMLLIMRVLQVPQSQIDKIYIDELGTNAAGARKMSYSQMAERYANYKLMKNAGILTPFYSDELEKKRKKSHKTSFKKKVNERKKLNKEAKQK